MRLHRHDELVEAMAKARCRADGFAWGAISSTLQRDYLKNAAAALDALLEAAVRLEVARNAVGMPGHCTYGEWWANTHPVGLREPEDFPALILRMEARAGLELEQALLLINKVADAEKRT